MSGSTSYLTPIMQISSVVSHPAVCLTNRFTEALAMTKTFALGTSLQPVCHAAASPLVGCVYGIHHALHGQTTDAAVETLLGRLYNIPSAQLSSITGAQHLFALDRGYLCESGL